MWHKDENVSDYVIGFAAIDLGILLHDSFTEISGWYNVMDFVGRCRGQINVNIKPKSYANIKAAGKYRQEGKTYIMQDGDIVHFMFNVTAKKK